MKSAWCGFLLQLIGFIEFSTKYRRQLNLMEAVTFLTALKSIRVFNIYI